MKKRLFDLSMLVIVMFLLAMPLWLLALLGSKPATTLVVTERFFMFLVIFMGASIFAYRVLDAIAMRPEMRKALKTAVTVSFILFVPRVFPPFGQRHEALAHVAQLFAVSLLAGIPTAFCWELWRSRRKTRNVQLKPIS
jgi:hypothetical protein